MTYSPNVEARIRTYPVGTKVKAIHFAFDENTETDDNENVPPGTVGVVKRVDATGTVHTNWENGCQLGFLEVDQVEIIN